MTENGSGQQQGFEGSGCRRRGHRLGRLALGLAGSLLLGGCYVVPAGYPVAGPAYVVPAPVVVAAPVYVAPAYGYGYGWGWRRHGRW